MKYGERSRWGREVWFSFHMNLYRHNSTFKVKPTRLKQGGKLKAGRRMKRSRHSLQESRWSKAVRERDNNTCQFPGCGKQENLDTHHIAMRSLRPDLRFDVNNGVTLCRKHHSWVSRVGNRDEAVAMGLLDLTTYELSQKQRRERAA